MICQDFLVDLAESHSVLWQRWSGEVLEYFWLVSVAPQENEHVTAVWNTTWTDSVTSQSPL